MSNISDPVAPGPRRFTVNEEILAAMAGWEDYSPEGPAQVTRELLYGAWEYGALADTVMLLPPSNGSEPEPWLMWEYLPVEAMPDRPYYRWRLDTGNNDFLVASHEEPIYVFGRAHKDHSPGALDSSARTGLESAQDVIREAAAEGNLLWDQFTGYANGRPVTGEKAR